MLETNRLFIKPLTYNQLIKYRQLDGSLEEELGLFKSSRTISPELSEALEQTIIPGVADQNRNYLYSTLWTIISKELNKMVGDLCFYGEPNSQGEVEIGYGIYSDYWKQGYMTEALESIILWAKNQENIESILASTEKHNLASFIVLQKNNFIKTGEADTLFHWKLKIKDNK